MLELSPALTFTVVLAAVLVPVTAYPARPELPFPAPVIEADVDSAPAGSPLSWLQPALLAAEKTAARRQIETAEDSVAVAARAGVTGAELAPSSALIATLKVRVAASKRSLYPDEMVRKVIWFTNTGEGFHDAPWRSAFGPGSNLNDGSHGCVNLTDAAADRLFTWAEIGTPVIVYPGDGSAPAEQLAQRSVDQHGEPLDGARGA